MKQATIYEDLGTIEYQKAWDYQETSLQEIQDLKRNTESKPKHRLLFCEHPHVYTLGKSGAENNLLINDAFLEQIGASYFKSNRGGDITYHGPGQIVGYPIFDLDQMGFQVKKYIYKLEDVIISTLNDYGIESDRLEGATGVWLEAKNGLPIRKICAIGVRVSRWVTMHGFALNVNTDLSYFNHINPCGFVDKGVTSMEKELGKTINFDEVKDKIRIKMIEEFNLEF